MNENNYYTATLPNGTIVKRHTKNYFIGAAIIEWANDELDAPGWEVKFVSTFDGYDRIRCSRNFHGAKISLVKVTKVTKTEYKAA